MAKEYFLSHNIPFEEIDVSYDKATIKEFIAKTGQTAVPVIEVDGKFIFGFDKKEINDIFNITT